MEIETVTVELLRAGPRHNQLVSRITQYLGVCGDSPASRVSLPYEHGELERRLQELRYAVTSEDDAHRASKVLEQTGREIAEVLSSIDGVAGMLNPKQGRPQTLTHLRIVLSASELAMLPFEAAKVPTGTGAGSVWLAVQTRAPVCITRHIRSVSADGTPWPSAPRILFVAGPETPINEHRAALEAVLQPWRDTRDGVGHLLRVLERPKVADVAKVLADASAKSMPFTHVHVLAHGMQLDERDRYSPVGLVLSDDEEPVPGDRLATALTSVAESGTYRPAIVTLASCDSGRQVDVRTADAGVAHELHDRGIPLVVASQFPLSIEGSIPFVTRFYEGQLRGEHPLVSLYAVRRDLHSAMSLDTHDWASLVVYEALPADLAAQLEEVRYWQARRAQEGALLRLEAHAREDDGANERKAVLAAALVDVEDRLAALPARGPYALECAGLRAAAYKRIAQAALEQVLAAGPGARANSLITECRRRLDNARTEYWRATKTFLAPSSEALRRKSNLHWLLGQVISLDVVLGQPLDKALLITARLAAEIDLEGASAVDRAWAHVSLTEFALLELADVGLSEAEREAQARTALDHARRILDLVGRASEHVSTTARQFDRYVSWWGNPDRQSLFAEMGIPGRPHWHASNGLVPTAQRVVALLRGQGETPADDGPGGGTLNAAGAKASVANPVAPTTKGARAKSLLAHAPTDLLFAVEMLPAENGDCLLVEYGNATRPSRVLIDCGAKSTVPAIARRFGDSAARTQAFDLFLLTHIDADHINGVLSMFDRKDLSLRFDDIWFNGWHQISRFLGVRQAEDFSTLLEDPKRKLRWNGAFSRKGDKHPAPVVVDDRTAPPSVTLRGGMQLTLLSPGPAELKRLAKDWQKVLLELNPKKAAMLARRTPPAPVKDFERFELEPLAAAPTKPDPSVANGSSIALLAEFDGRSVLLTGDAHANVVIDAIAALQTARGRAGEKLKVDALKLSHHGSANATTIPLLAAIDCPRYLVSSNGNIFYHPDRESIARVILHGGKQPTLYFNYRSTHNALWDSAVLRRRYGYSAHYPNAGAEGLRVDL